MISSSLTSVTCSVNDEWESSSVELGKFRWRRSGDHMSGNSRLVGWSKFEVQTPALCLDLDAYHRNVSRMSDFITRQCGINWRPHIKSQKIPALACYEVNAGAIGVACAKLSEAEIMAAAGISDILIANQVVGMRKAEALARLQRQGRVIVAVDNLYHLDELGKAATAQGLDIPVVVEIDLGFHRCGVLPGEPAVSLACLAAQTAGLRFVGVMGWEAHALRLDGSEKLAAIEKAIRSLVETAEMCRAAGLSVEIVSCGGTGTYQHTSTFSGVTEIQAGGGVFGDATYSRWGIGHELALTVLATIISRPNPTRIVVDAGIKALSIDHGPPVPLGVNRYKEIKLSAEHGVIELEEPDKMLMVGKTIEFVPGWADTTLCLHDEMCGIRKGQLEVVWPITARGKLW